MLKIDARSSSPIYEQIVLGIKELILKGVIRPGEKLPSVRELSNLITANHNTVSKAYGELEREGIIESEKGRGTFVVENYNIKYKEERLNKVRAEINKLILEARYIGINKEDIINLIEETYKNIGGVTRC